MRYISKIVERVIMLHYIYRIVNTKNNKSYIGYTIDPDRRWKSHKKAALRGKGYALHAAMREYGIESFIFTVLYKSENRWETLTVKEQDFIEMYDSKNNGYNLTNGGAGALGWKPSPETRKLWSEQRTGRRHSEEYKKALSTRMKENPPMHNPEARKKLSDTLKRMGRRPPSSPEIIEKIRKANTGKPKHTHEHKLKMSERLKRKPLLSNPKALEKQKRNRKGKGTGARNGNASFCNIFNADGELFATGHLRTLCDTHQLPYNTFSENSRKEKSMQRGRWKGCQSFRGLA